MMINYLEIDVYRTARRGDCTNRGISSRFDTLLVACPDGPWSFDPEVSIPLNFCAVEIRRTWGGNTYTDIVPATVEDGQVVKRPGWWMYGGNIASCTDSRFHELTGIDYPIQIHDRRE